MKLKRHTDRDYVNAYLALLPPGAAWKWPEGGFGDALLLGLAQEPVRLEGDIQAVLDAAIERHRPATRSWHIDEYRKVAAKAIAGVSETMPRKPFAVGSKVGDRLWSHAAPTLTFPVDLVRIDHLLGPLRVGSRVGDRLWSTRSRYVIRVRYYRSVVDPKVLWDALTAFKQEHVYLWFEDITGVGGSYAPN